MRWRSRSGSAAHPGSGRSASRLTTSTRLPGGSWRPRRSACSRPPARTAVATPPRAVTSPASPGVLDDHTLAIPERPGNRRLDSLRNVLANPHVGLLFVVPGVPHTLRVNGTARVVADAGFFDEMAVYGRRPVAALLVSVTECYFHCGKA